MTLEFCLLIFGKNTQISNFMEIRPARAELFHTEGQAQTDTDRQTDNTLLTYAILILFRTRLQK